MTLDPVTLDAAGLAVLIGRLEGIADEMGAVLRRAAFSPNIKERADCSAALFNAAGEQLVQAEHIPVHLGAMPASVRAVLDAFPGGRRSCRGRPGGRERSVRGRHPSQRRHVRRAGVRRMARSWDGRRTGPITRTSAAARRGRCPRTRPRSTRRACASRPCSWSPALRALILANSRTPDERGGDLDAQLGANVLGARRLAELDRAR